MPDVVLHAFTDGRDTHPDAGAGYVAEVEGWMPRARQRAGRAASAGATTRWTATAAGIGSSSLGRRSSTAGPSRSAAERGRGAVRAAYERDETDEFIKPTLVADEARIRDEDAVLFFNFRPDRARELTGALGDPILRSSTAATPPRPP